MLITKFERFDQALDRAKENAQRLENSQTADIIADLIHSIDLLADIVANLQKDDGGPNS